MQLLKAAAEAEANRDRLSNLPDDVLLNILERLGTLDAIRTCILSKQMLHLPAMLTRIDIGLSPLSPSPRNALTTHIGLLRANNAVADAANKILCSRPPPPHTVIAVRQVKLRFLLKLHWCLSHSCQEPGSLGSRNEVAENITRHTRADLLYFAKQFNKFLCSCPDAFAGLTRLRLQNLWFRQESDIPNILGTCKRLYLIQCDTCRILSVLRVEHAELVDLRIALGRFMKVELNCLPKLQRMTYTFQAKPKPHKHSGRHATFKLSQLLANAPSMSDLHLDFATAPSLEELCITVWDHWCGRVRRQGYSQKTNVEWEPAAELKHKSLAKLTIYGFQSNDNFTGYIRCVMRAAVNLKEVSLHDRKACRLCAKDGNKVRPSRYPGTNEEKDSSREKITQGLGLAKASRPAAIHFRS
ncbi:LOW QUALITY PROTEIN: hypothetical protein BRADI_3g55639v3 [Brachypodium distachyon]|uniref:F-box domain-containing protein n=1 Tax=Brachypodium distachyon TaxID=15368 RepID=A0A2K2D595_BRADI|nr:LOW QUALITY PROTEIN: hypothetical protein BRADI_3g55639v3 [Brachypodium distachyon]